MSGIDYVWLRIIPLLNLTEGQKVVAAICEEAEFDTNDFYSLVEAEIEKLRFTRRFRLFETFDEIFLNKFSDVD